MTEPGHETGGATLALAGRAAGRSQVSVGAYRPGEGRARHAGPAFRPIDLSLLRLAQDEPAPKDPDVGEESEDQEEPEPTALDLLSVDRSAWAAPRHAATDELG